MAKSDKLKKLIEEVRLQIEGYEAYHQTRKRARRGADQVTFERMIEALVCDLCRVQLGPQYDAVHLPLSNKILRKASRYKSPVLGKTLPDVLHIMTAPEMDFAVLTKGHKHFQIIDQDLSVGPTGGVQSTLAPGPKLLSRIDRFAITQEDVACSEDQETIVLRRAKRPGQLHPEVREYTDTNETQHLRAQMQNINAYLAAAYITCDHPTANACDRYLRRIFNNDTFEQGGRLYGGFWQGMRSDDRHMHIVIEGDRLAELDVGQTGILALYKLAGATPPTGDLYDLSSAGIPTAARDGIKKVMNAMVSASKPLSRLPKGARKSLPRRYSLRQVTEAINKVHPSLEGHWCRGLYGAVWRIESDALVELLTRLNRDGIVALPIHDAVLVADKNKHSVLYVMLEVYEKALGVQPTVTVS